MRSGDVAAALGRGLVAGVAGTAAMTLSSSIEARLRKREPSTAPADAASKLLGVRPTSADGAARFSTAVHWMYGTTWGVVRGAIGALGLPPAVAGSAHFAAVWGTDLVMLPRLEIAPPVREWGRSTLAIDALHHAVYATATTLACVFLGRRAEPTR